MSKAMLWATVLAMSAVGTARGQESEGDRLKKLEDQLKTQQGEIDALKKGQSGAGVSASWADGIKFKSADGNVDVRIGGRCQENFRAVLDRPDASRTTTDTFYLRAARLSMSGTLYKDYGFQVESDFASSSTGSAPTVQAAFVEWKKLKEFRLMFGQFKAPMGQEYLPNPLFGDFAEDSPLVRFVPGYELGVQALGQVASGIVGYQAAITNGRGHLANAGRSRSDDNDEKEYLARVTLSPWTGSEEVLLKGFRGGLSGSVTDADSVAITGAAVTAFDIATSELGVTFLDPTATAGTASLDGRRTRFGTELSWAAGPACLRAEYLRRRDEMVNGVLDETVLTKVWTVALTCLVTGEDKTPESRVIPLKSLGEDGGLGAVELALRMAVAEVGDEIEDLNVPLAGQSNKVSTLTAGVNWWLTRNVRVTANVVREDYHDEINFGGGREEDALTGFLGRVQIDF